MSLTIAAQHLASKGRGEDTELVHMTKGEIKGLRQLAMSQGGDLSINPYTGLVEAGILSKILPMVAIAAATYFTAGAATPAIAGALEGTALAGSAGILGGAASGALIGGIASGIQGGDPLKGALFGGIGGGITGGLGGYESAPNVLSGIGDTSNAIAQSGAQAGNLAATTGSTLEAANQAVTQAGTQTGGAANLVGESYAVPRNPALGYAGTEQGIVNPSVMPQPPGAPPTGSYYSGLGTGMMDTAKKAAILGAPGILAQGYGMTPEQGQALPTGKYTSKLSRISPDFQAQEPSQPSPYPSAEYPDYTKKPYGYAVGGSVDDELGMDSARGIDVGNLQKGLFGMGHASGGPIAFANRGEVVLPRSPAGFDPGIYTDTDPNTARLGAYNAALYRINKARAKAGIKEPMAFKKTAELGDIEEAAKGGIMQGHSSLGGYSDGGRMLKGPGDGMSDSIPATIGRKQPARLADGEFVVPADVVSHLGNGSTDAGARKLYSMMDKIRKARTGKKKQAPEVKTDKYLPA